MNPFIFFFRKITGIIRKGLVGSSIGAISVLVYGTFSEYYLENPIPSSGIHTLFDSLWWVMQTLTTVGYGDTAVVGFWGRLNAMVIMVVGIGSLGYLLASVSANIVNSRLAERLGGVRAKMRDHVIVCNYDSSGKELIRKMNKAGFPVVLVSQKAIEEEGIEFQYIRGSCLDGATLDRAGISKSDTIIILAGKYTDSEESTEIDARTIVMGMNAKRRNSEIRVIAELVDQESEVHAVAAGIDQVIVRGKFSTEVMSKAVFSPGVASLVQELISDDGIYRVEEHPLRSLKGKKAEEAYRKFTDEGHFVLGFRRGETISYHPGDNEILNYDEIILLVRNRKIKKIETEDASDQKVG